MKDTAKLRSTRKRFVIIAIVFLYCYADTTKRKQVAEIHERLWEKTDCQTDLENSLLHYQEAYNYYAMKGTRYLTSVILFFLLYRRSRRRNYSD